MIPIDNHIPGPLASTDATKCIVDHSGWTYVSLGDSKLMESYTKWLQLHLCYKDYCTWDYYAKGIYFKEAQAAIAFKLTFQL